MWEAFHLAFDNYAVRFQLSQEQFYERFVEKLQLNYACSPSVFVDGRLVAFIFTSLNTYQGVATCYNGGTGVVPEHRGQRLSQQMYTFVEQQLHDQQVAQFLLEVICSNERAIATYRKAGFEVSRRFHCLHLTGELRSTPAPSGLRIKKVVVPDMGLYIPMQDIEASFIDSNQHLLYHLDHEVVLEAELDGQLVGYIIYQHESGRISQIGVHPGFRRKAIGTHLLHKALSLSIQKKLSVINIEENQEGILAFLAQNGFTLMIEQYEMVRKLS